MSHQYNNNKLDKLQIHNFPLTRLRAEVTGNWLATGGKTGAFEEGWT